MEETASPSCGVGAGARGAHWAWTAAERQGSPGQRRPTWLLERCDDVRGRSNWTRGPAGSPGCGDEGGRARRSECAGAPTGCGRRRDGASGPEVMSTSLRANGGGTAPRRRRPRKAGLGRAGAPRARDRSCRHVGVGADTTGRAPRTSRAGGAANEQGGGVAGQTEDEPPQAGAVAAQGGARGRGGSYTGAAVVWCARQRECSWNAVRGEERVDSSHEY